MKLFDSIYGEYTPHSSLDNLIRTPIVQRLRWIALSNIPSLTYPMISGVSRYAHSLGVAHLGNIVGDVAKLNDGDRVNVVCAGLLHDAGMPPLGHITEEAMYSLDIKFDHEKSLRMILLNEGRRFFQMPDGEKIGVTEALQKADADAGKIFSAITGGGLIGKYVSSSMDIDNIDNVIRLYRLIFPDQKGYSPLDVVSGYFSESSDGEKYRNQWDEVRLKLYTKLMFSIDDFAQKATMKRVIKKYLEMELENKPEETVIDSFRFLNDNQFLGKILSSLAGADSECLFYSGKYDRLVTFGWVDSISKETLEITRDDFPVENYYFDFIPDKRFKSKVKNSDRGALVGVFSYGNSGKKKDGFFKERLSDYIPSVRFDYTPADESKSDQISLI